MEAQFYLMLITPYQTNANTGLYNLKSDFLILEQAVVNEDTQGNVSQLQAEVKRLKEQLAQLTSGQTLPESLLTRGRMSTAGPSWESPVTISSRAPCC